VTSFCPSLPPCHDPCMCGCHNAVGSIRLVVTRAPQFDALNDRHGGRSYRSVIDGIVPMRFQISRQTGTEDCCNRLIVRLAFLPAILLLPVGPASVPVICPTNAASAFQATRDGIGNGRTGLRAGHFHPQCWRRPLPSSESSPRILPCLRPSFHGVVYNVLGLFMKLRFIAHYSVEILSLPNCRLSSVGSL
jgi:hypothetical protein